ncbi:MAG TPA: FAD-binding protein [Xanthobacteraceae bacterium]|nr:FAD-binding protein [Xanthobacteraceae bacterium]
MRYSSSSRGADGLSLQADVLVLGGGPAGAWAALAAARNGAKVILADKGRMGTSGATAPSNAGTWCVPPDENRLQTVERRWHRTKGLAVKQWMLRCVDTAYENLLRLSEWGYPFPHDDKGRLYVANLRGPDYMRFLRGKVLQAGVTILDHHPALELLSDGRAIAGAAGYDRQRHRDWTVAARAVVVATGGCAFFERILGGTGLTGDGCLMALEAGVSLSGMEFTGKYTIAPHGTSLNKGLPYRWASFFREDGSPIVDATGEPLVNAIGERETEVAKALLGGPVYARLDQADADAQMWLRRGQPNCFVPHDRRGIDPFSQMFRITMRAEGTVRGTGGIKIATEDCGTSVPGLYVAGDVASRENVTGAISGGGGVNASWAIASGWWSGQGAATFAREFRRGAFQSHLKPLGGAGLRPAVAASHHVAVDDIADTVRRHMLPIDRGYFRDGRQLHRSLAELEGAWSDVRNHLRAEGAERVHAREVSASLMAARCSVVAALRRHESRGIHRRLDAPFESPDLARPIELTGADARVVGLPTQSQLAS